MMPMSANGPKASCLHGQLEAVSTVTTELGAAGFSVAASVLPSAGVAGFAGLAAGLLGAGACGQPGFFAGCGDGSPHEGQAGAYNE